MDEKLDIVGLSTVAGVLPSKLFCARGYWCGADTIVFANCIQKGTLIGPPCPFAMKMKEIIAKDLGKSVTILDYTH